MGFNFPPTPAVNDTANGYKWNGYAWVPLSATGPFVLKAGDTMTGPFEIETATNYFTIDATDGWGGIDFLNNGSPRWEIQGSDDGPGNIEIWRSDDGVSINKLTSLWSRANGFVTFGDISPTYQITIHGAGQTAKAPTDAGVKGGSLFINDSTFGGDHGGALLLGTAVANGHLPQWAIKSALSDGTANGTGVLVLSTRRANADAFLTETARFDPGGVLQLSDTPPSSNTHLSVKSGTREWWIGQNAAGAGAGFLTVWDNTSSALRMWIEGNGKTNFQTNGNITQNGATWYAVGDTTVLLNSGGDASIWLWGPGIGAPQAQIRGTETKIQSSDGAVEFAKFDANGTTLTGPPASFLSLHLKAAAGRLGAVDFSDGAALKWRVGKDTDNKFIIYDEGVGYALTVEPGGLGTITSNRRVQVNRNCDPSLGVDTFGLVASGSFGGGIGLIDGTGNFGIWADTTGTRVRFGLGTSLGALTPIMSLSPIGLEINTAPTIGDHVTNKTYVDARQPLVPDYASVAAAYAAVDEILFPKGETIVSANATWPAGKVYKFRAGAYLTINNGVTLTINGIVDAPPNQYIFRSVGTGVVLGVSDVVPEWFGVCAGGNTDVSGIIQKAINSVQASLGSDGIAKRIRFAPKRYALGTGIVFTLHQNIPWQIIGAGHYNTTELFALSTMSSAQAVHLSPGDGQHDFTLMNLTITTQTPGSGCNVGLQVGTLGAASNGDHHRKIENVSVKNFKTHNIKVSGRQISFFRCSAWGNAVPSTTQLEIRSQGTEHSGDMVFTDCQFVAFQGNGSTTWPSGICVYMGADAGTDPNIGGTKFIHCQFYFGEYGVRIKASATVSGTYGVGDTWFTNCQWEGAKRGTTSDVVTTYAVRGEAEGNTVIVDLQIEGGYMVGNGYSRPIYMTTISSAQIFACSVRNNWINGGGNAGAQIEFAGVTNSIHGISICNNILRDPGMSAGGSAIFMGGVKQSSAVGNTLCGSSAGLAQLVRFHQGGGDGVTSTGTNYHAGNNKAGLATLAGEFTT